MQKKAKYGSRWQTQLLPFVVVWTISIVITTWITNTLTSTPFYNFMTGGVIAANTMMSLVIASLAQAVLIERLLKRSMRHWMLYTTAGGFLGLLLVEGFARSMVYSPYYNFDVFRLVLAIGYNVPVPLLQYFWLRQHVHRAWLWPIISVIALCGFGAIPLSRNYLLIETIMLMSIGVLQASLMHFLWKHPKQDETIRIDFDVFDDDGRLERLQERPLSTSLWDIGDDQALQREA